MKLGILTDIHCCPPGSSTDGWHNPHQFDGVLSRLERSLDWLREQGVDQVAVLGDISHHGDVDSIRVVIDLLVASGLPCWVLPGNHDCLQDASNLGTVMAAVAPATVEMPAGQVQSLGPEWKALPLPLHQVDWRTYRIAPEPDLASWGDTPMVLLTHFPLLSIRDDSVRANLKYAGEHAGAEGLVAALQARSAPIFVINGHLHIRHATTQGAVLQASCGAQIESLFEVTVVDFGVWSEGRISWTATAIDPEWPGVNPALSDREQSWRWTGESWRRDRQS